MRMETTLQDVRWIGGCPGSSRAPLLRREFSLGDRILSAELHISGLGYYEAWINGWRVGDEVLDPAQTDYETRVFYASHDVTSLLREGANALGVMLGNGWYNQNLVWSADMAYGTPRLWAELTVRMADGSSLVIRTDESWRCADGPVVSNNIYAGETCDARLEIPGWNLPGFVDRAWSPVTLAEPPGGRLEPQNLPPIRRIEELKPVALREVQPGLFVADLGQNFSGWVRIRVQAAAGTEIRLKFAEAVFPDGRIDTASTGVFATKVEQVDTYICKGEGTEIWEPRFTYHGFRYVEITGWPGRPGPDDLTGVVVHTALEPAGNFECSDARLNQLHRMALWTHRSNVHGLPEDCPARERCGWLGDAHIVCEYSLFNFRSESLWGKYLDDIETNRALSGGLPGYIAPGRRRWHPASPDWMAAFILIPWFLHVHGGNRRVLGKHWDGMRAVMEHFGSKAQDGILSGGLGDWCDPKNRCNPTYTPEAITTTMWFWRCADIMVKVAGVLARDGDAQRYAEWAAKIPAAFHARFFDRAGGTYGSQTANAMALRFGLVPKDEEGAVVQSLVKDIRETHRMHHSVGIMGLRFLFEALTEHGHGEIALALLRQDTYPSFGDLIRRGATTLWEYWGEPEIDQAEGPRSLSHPMMGGFDNWFYNTLAGIRPDPDAPGFRHFFLAPHLIPSLEWVRCHHDCAFGRIESHWRCDGRRFDWETVVPPGTRATATLPFARHSETLKPGRHSRSLALPAS